MLRRRRGIRPTKTVIAELRALGNPAAMAGRERFGLPVEGALGVSVPKLRKLARAIGTDHALALALWRTKIHEARILSCLIGDPDAITEAEMESWLHDFASWDICDGCCLNLFDRTPIAYRKATEWTRREPEFEKRAAFALMAALAVHDKGTSDRKFLKFLKLIERCADDDRNYVRKAVNWALRQIGKRNLALNAAAIESGERIRAQGTRSARWIAADALRELRSAAVQAKVRK